ncbi:hypothetical protein [Paraburkholderia solisilvae]|uniref:Uncharacterized protein n=1 Tax=Paraburkholderia solisilvae TaxID=624376 RepID=A0A6J5EW03_9BURK|nr:hypothetical protein [Paraburkholderia solisilvae]CAB3770778.1 hypothetical protein LMG29739_05871 [Paraburkholderia solisilvae]
MNIIRSIVAASLLAAGISFAQAQEPPSNDQTVHSQADVTRNTQGDQRRDNNNPSNYPSGFNTGPTKANVRGCVGPVSYCNIYFGS